MKHRILIACPLGPGKEYSINEWFSWISNQTYPDVDVAVCVNGKDQKQIMEKVELLRQVEINHKKIRVLQLDYNPYYSFNARLCNAREKLRSYAFIAGHDYIFWLDSDVIPLLRDSIELLLNHKKDVISGLYFYKKTKQAVVVDHETGTNIKMEKLESLVRSGKIIQVPAFGFGCVLMNRKAFSSVKFDYEHKRELWSDDVSWCDLAVKKGFELWFDARIACRHHHKADFIIK